MASKKTSKSRPRQSLKDLSPRERQAKGVSGGGARAAVSAQATAYKLPTSTAARVAVSPREP